MSIGDCAKIPLEGWFFSEIRENVLPVYPDFPRSLQQVLFDIASKFASLTFLNKRSPTWRYSLAWGELVSRFRCTSTVNIRWKTALRWKGGFFDVMKGILTTCYLDGLCASCNEYQWDDIERLTIWSLDDWGATHCTRSFGTLRTSNSQGF